MSNVKAGQMAEIIGGLNKGGIVEVLRVSKYYSELNGELSWEVKTAWPLLFVRGELKGTHGTKGVNRDSRLRPIRPPEQPETVTNEETAEA